MWRGPVATGIVFRVVIARSAPSYPSRGSDDEGSGRLAPGETAPPHREPVAAGRGRPDSMSTAASAGEVGQRPPGQLPVPLHTPHLLPPG